MAKAVRIDKSGRVIERQVKVSKGGDDQIQWESQGNGGPWIVLFPAASPFESPAFIVPTQGYVMSGIPFVNHSTRAYKYEVRDGNGRLMDDPDVIVDP